MNIKKILSLVLSVVLAVAVTACGNKDIKENEFSLTSEIGVISREDGSGTRGAFVELFGVEQKNSAGEKVDMTTPAAVIAKSTSVILTTVAGDDYAIGYTSLGSLNDTVKAVKIDGVEATVENIKNGSYKIARPFNIATKANVSEAAQDFINYIMSAEGQKIIADEGYISIDDAAPAYTGGVTEGKITISGSSSVTPVMEKLKEAYLVLNPDVDIRLNQTDSSSGMTDAADGISDIGMASRDLKDSETAKGIVGKTIAMDGIAVVVNHANPVDNLTKDQVMNIYTGNTLTWSDII